MSTIKLHPYQRKAIAAISKRWAQGEPALLVQATGTGKTIVMGAAAQKVVANGGRVLILAHRGELLDQAQDKLQRFYGITCAREQAEHSALASDAPVVVASVQTLAQPDRLAQWPQDAFTHIFVDECHHAASDTYTRVLEHFSSALRLGVTATPDRGDRRSIEPVFGEACYQYLMDSAIRDGFLAPVRARLIPLRLDVEGAWKNGDYQAQLVGDALEPYLAEIAAQMGAAGLQGHRTVVFTPLIATSLKLQPLLEAQGLRVAEINGQSQDRAEILAKFDAGEIDVLLNSMLLTEGWDCPSVDHVVVLRPTRSRGLYAQMVGRGTRTAPGKDALTILDFLWLSGRHDLVHPAALFAPSAAVAAAATREIADAGELDVMDAIERGERDVVAERESALARELAEMRKRRGKLVDPLVYAVSIEDEEVLDLLCSDASEWELRHSAPMSDRQREQLERAGVATDRPLTKRQASTILQRIKARRDAGAATPKQVRMLESKGFTHPGAWTFEAASRVMSILADNHWQWPSWRMGPAEDYMPDCA